MFEQRTNKRKGTAVVKAQLVIRTTPEEFDAISEAAERAGLTKSDFIRQAIVDKMQKENG